MNINKIIELLKSGDFTILYHDNQSPSLYKGKFKSYEDLPENAKEIEIDNYDDGYAPTIVILLIKALGGEIDSI